jgi:hypothetical protein
MRKNGWRTKEHEMCRQGRLRDLASTTRLPP